MGIYFDNGATSYPKPEAVYTSMDTYLRQNGASAGRGNYRRAMVASELMYEARKAVAGVLGVKSPSKIVFTANVTEALNLVLKGIIETGDQVLTTNYEHNAMWRPLMRLATENQVDIHQLQCSASGVIDLDELETALRRRPKLLCLAHGSNVLGNVLPLREIAALAHEHGVPVLVDAAQTAGAVPLEATNWGLDFLAFTGHKSLLGPMGTGGLYLHGDTPLKTLKEGGTGSSSLSPFQPLNPPDRYEAGTMNIPALAGLKAAAEFLVKTSVETVAQHERKLITALMMGMSAMSEIRLYGVEMADPRLALVTFNIGEQNPYDVAAWLDEHYGIMVRAGLHCAPQAHRLLGTEDRGAVRISLSWFNTEEEIKICIEALSAWIETKGVK